MFIRGSRYRNLEESTPINSKGERHLIKNLRLITSAEGQFEHTVNQGDRLDLLAYKYYRNSTKWWQINDANPEFSFPTDLLDQEPLAEEKFLLTHPGFENRFHDLIVVLEQLGSEVEVKAPEINPFSSNPVPLKPDFIASTVVVVYDHTIASRRQDIINAIKNEEFHLLNSFHWPLGTLTAEAFTFDDEKVKKNWQELTRSIQDTSGVIEVISQVTESSLYLIYNKAVIQSASILAQIQAKDFAAKTVNFSRLGKKTTIPPNQVV